MGSVVINDDGTLSVTGDNYVYLLSNQTENNWKFLASGKTSGDLGSGDSNYYPASASDGCIIGYSYDSSTGIFTAGSGANKSGLKISSSEVYLSGELDVYGDFFGSDRTIYLVKDTMFNMIGDVGFHGTTTFDFGDLTNNTSVIKKSCEKQIWNVTGLTFNASYDMASTGSTTLSYTLIDNAAFYSYTPSTSNITGNISVTGLNNETLSYIGVITDISTLHEGESALLVNGGTISLVASSVVPEPTTATLSLLALAGLAVRRRRK